MKFRSPKTPLTEEQMLNRKKVYHQITSEPESFQMGYWDSSIFDFECKTVRCIAGWACYFSGKPVTVNDEDDNIEQRAIDAMGLSHDEYYADWACIFYVSDSYAITIMRRLAGEDE